MASYLRCATGHPHVDMANFGQTNFGQLWCYSHIVWPNTVMTKSGLWCGVCVVVASGPPGLHTTAQAQMCTFQGPGLQTQPKFNENTSKGSKNIVAGEGRKSAKFWAHPSAPHPSAPTALPFGAPTRLKHWQKSVWPKSTSATHVPMELEEKPTLTVAEKPGDRP